MKNMKIRIQTIGSFLDQLKKFLEPENIVIESSIVGCNPLAMEGKTDEQYLKYAGDANLKSNAVLNIKKNLSSMLSRNPDKFCQNYNVQPFGQNMRIKNTSDYIVFMNYSATTPVFERDGVVYSDLELSSDFIKALHGNNTYTKRLFPFKEDFNWRYYYDKFIDAVMREYDSSHIIFIKTNSAQWYMEKKELHAFGKRSSQFRNLISEMDNYFIERTRCMVIDEHYNHTPTENLPMAWFPYARMNQAALKCIAKDVTNIIYGINSEKYKFSGAKKGNDFAKQLQLRLSSDTIKQNQTHINRIICDWFTFDDIRKYSEENQFFSNLVKLEKFIDYKNPAYLSDYAVELLADTNTVNSNVNVDLVDLYTRYFKLDINDLIAVYKLYEVSDKKSEYKKIIGNVINNSDCIPVNSATYSKNDNLRILKDYTYLNDAYKNKSNDKMYIRLENNCFLVLDKSSDECIKLSYDKIKTQVDHTNVLNNGLNCHVECADALTYSCDYYVEKARRGLGAKPTYLKFDSQDDFLDSLNYIDYCELLKNERFVFVIGDEELAEPQEYMPITNLTELMDPNTVTVKIDAGLGDQISRYIIGQLIKDFSKRKVIYDNQCRHFNGCEVIKLAKEQIPMLNSMLSERINDFAGSNTFGKIIQKISESSVFASFSPMHDEYKYYNAFYARKKKQ